MRSCVIRYQISNRQQRQDVLEYMHINCSHARSSNSQEGDNTNLERNGVIILPGIDVLSHPAVRTIGTNHGVHFNLGLDTNLQRSRFGLVYL